MCILKRLQGQYKPVLAALSQKAVQRYNFLRTQPNKMHKNRPFVHISSFLCNISPLTRQGSQRCFQLRQHIFVLVPDHRHIKCRNELLCLIAFQVGLFHCIFFITCLQRHE